MKELIIPPETSRDDVFETVRIYLGDLSLRISSPDFDKPWGGEYYIDEADSGLFVAEFFPDVDESELLKYGAHISPKILMTAPDGKASWQYHNRRDEIWRALTPIGIKLSDSDKEPENYLTLDRGELHRHASGIRHTFMGIGEWGIIAEIWHHTIKDQPSDRYDNIRLKDQYGRPSPVSQ